MKKLTRYHVLTALVVVMLLAVGGTLVASNMGFKLVDSRTFVGGNLNQFGIALPHNTSYATCDDFLADQFDGSNDLTAIKYDNTGGAFVQRTIYSGYYGSGFSGTVFNVEPGVGFTMKITANLTTTIVGSQDPNFTYPALTYVAGNLNQFGVALTPNTKWTTCDEALTAWFDGSNDLTAIKYDNTGGAFVQRTIYSGYYGSGFSGTQFALAPGMGFDLKINANLPARSAEPYY